MAHGRRDRTTHAPSRTLLVGAALLSALCGCSPPDDDRVASFVVRDSAGISIAENPAPDRSIDLLAVSRPALEIGVRDGPEELQLFRVSDLGRLSDGSVVVVNAGSRDVRIYGDDGRHRVTFGGPGQGPDEFGYPGGIHVLPGDIIVVSDRLDRVRFSGDGTFLGRETGDRGALRELWSSSPVSEGGSWTPAGTLLVLVHAAERTGSSPGPLRRPAMTLTRVDATFARADTLGVFGGILQQRVEVDDRVTAVVPPYPTTTSWAVGALDGTIAVGDNAVPQLHLFGASEHRIVRWVDEPEAVTPSEADAWTETERELLRERAPDQLPRLERAWAQMDLPESKPHYATVAIGQGGDLWVAADILPIADPATFLVFDPEGAYRGSVTVPGPFTVLDSGPDWVLGVHRDETDVEYVRLYELTTDR